MSGFCENLNQKEVASARAETEYGRLLTALWAQEHLGTVVDGVIIEQTKGGMTVLDTSRFCQLSVPYSELRNSGKRDSYKLGDPITVQIYEAKTDRYPIVHASENLDKYEQIQNGTFDLSADPKYHTAPPADTTIMDSEDGSQM